ncbi:hypothetical protein BDB00DRAFT_829186 [Zychaea mexicana]|uniref:uncharacterized protein n=1 Tax=Zychaea mexicana TaxID=64656 RepID=UPI0022FF27EA|nr:uncharacterized protein BDB00DRAFT_829186 [Zychaea mexicana]KAI9492292.1 hypothetical protein BDB00DRAFT_829186 [Zychaea mexicana]
MMEASKDAASSNSLLQRCNDLQNLCETVRTERNYSKRSFDLVSSSDALIPLTKRARSEATEILTTTITATTSSSSEEESALPVAMRPSLDREAFYKRLETFSAPFVSKRRPVNAVQCAMHGFVDTHVVGGPKQNICKLLCPSCQCTNFVIDISCFKTSVPKGNLYKLFMQCILYI